MPVRSRCARSLGLAGGVLVAATLSACSSPAPAEITRGPSVVGAGKHYRYSAADVPTSQWPNPCALLTRAAGEAALGTAITMKRFHTSCYYQPASPSYPTLTIKLGAVGTDPDPAYRQSKITNAGLDRTSIDGVGRKAYLHPVRHLPAYRLDVLSHYAYFTVTAQSPYSQQQSVAQARASLVVVGKVVAKAFAR